MKNLITSICAILVIASTTYGQGNLQFNQVISVSFDLTAASSGFYSLGTLTVPAGKVWKIERTSLDQEYLGNLYPQYNGSSYAHIGDYVVWNNTTTYPQHLFPLWLAEGTYPMTCSPGNSGTYHLAVSAIEFNVIP